MPCVFRVFAAVAVLLPSLVAPAGAADPPAVTLITLGDSITKGVRPGVSAEQTFAWLVEQQLKAEGIAARVVNVGIGGERTDQALERLDKVIAQSPRLVTVMYGTNDSYVDPDHSESRLTLDAYRDNLKKIVSQLLLAGIEPVLMTEPRWADDAKDGRGENPNVRLESYLAACRGVARQCAVPLVDHFAHWAAAESKGQKLRDWTTDSCHPNPRGHQEMAATMSDVLLAALRSDTRPVDFQIKLETLLEHDDGKFLWFHPRVAAIPTRAGPPTVLLTLQKHLQVSDYYSGLHVMRSDDLGKTWTGPDAPEQLDWVPEPGGVNVAVCDVTPGWHPQSQKVIAIGAQVRYSPKGEQLEDRLRSNQTAYAVLDPKARAWSPWRRLAMPPDEKFNFAYSACAQFLVEPDGTLLLPFYFGPHAKQPFSVTVVRSSFDGTQLKYLEHGDEISLDVERGLVEPSLVKFQNRYYLTIRNDLKGYVTVGDDPLRYRPIKAWTFDDGTELGSYNTQQHWLAHGDSLFLAYTRKGANNDHVFRHRAPLFIAQVDPRRLHVLRATERVLIPERGATLGNFGAAAIDARESWVTDAEGVFGDDARRRGATGAVYLARVIWPSTPGDRQTRTEPAQGAAYQWINVTHEAAYAPRDGAGALTFHGRMWLVGGWNPGDKRHFPRICNNEVWSSADGARWTLEKPNTFLDRAFDPASDWEGRHSAGYVVHDDKMWIIGGDSNQGHYQNDVWNSSDGRTWTRVNHGKDPPWAPRALHHTLVFGDKMWVIGGQTMPAFAPADEVFYRDLWTTSDGASWTRVEPREPYWSPRGMIGGSAVFQGRIWILGGGTYDTPKSPARNFYNDVWSSPDGVHWTRHLEHAPWHPRQYHDAAVFDDKLWVLEGYHQQGGNRNDVWHSSDGVNWHELVGTPWKPRHAASIFVFDGALWMVAGNNMQQDVWKLVRASGAGGAK
jgi:lysophospholipase L1-like esterase